MKLQEQVTPNIGFDVSLGPFKYSSVEHRQHDWWTHRCARLHWEQDSWRGAISVGGRASCN